MTDRAIAIQAAMQIALGASPAGVIKTILPNDPAYTPQTDVPYQEVAFVFGEPSSLEFGAGYQEIGFMQVTLAYPKNGGWGDAAAQAGKIRDAFPRGATFVENGVTVVVFRPPYLLPDDRSDPTRFKPAVRVPFIQTV
jgi:hypothetical protein